MILTGVGIYLAVMLGIGFYASRKSHSLADFIVAGRTMPFWICTISIFATWFGGGPMTGSAAAAYDGNILFIIADPLAAGVALFLTGLLFARLYRRSMRLTWIELFEVRYGTLASVTAAIIDIIVHIIWLGGMLFVFGVVFETLTGAPQSIGILGGLLVIIVYTMVGGLWAVALTDFLQMLIVVVGLGVLSVVVLSDAGGWSAITAELPERAFRIVPVDHTLANWIEHIHIWLAAGLSAVVSSVTIQRALAAKNEAVAQNAFYGAAGLYLTVGMIPLALGYAGRVLLPDIADSNAIVPELAIAYLHPVAVVVFVGAIIPAARLSVPTCYPTSGRIRRSGFA